MFYHQSEPACDRADNSPDDFANDTSPAAGIVLVIFLLLLALLMVNLTKGEHNAQNWPSTYQSSNQSGSYQSGGGLADLENR